MKDKRKLLKRKTQKRVFRKRLTYGIMAVAVVAFAFFVYYSNQRQVQADKFLFKAAIVDHLSKGGITPWPNQTFIESSRNILQNEGFQVVSYSYEDSNVSLYRQLATYGYGLIILRVHSAIVEGSHLLGLFTSESYSNETYHWEQSSHQLVKAFYTQGGSEYFAVAPGFIDTSVQGTFQNTIIILMGCDGLRYSDMTEAFIRKGAKTCIGWNGTVDARHTDIATDYLLRCLVTYRYSIEYAVNETIQVIGPAPSYGSVLTYYPTTAGNYVIPSYTNLASNVNTTTIFLMSDTEVVSQT